MRVAPLISLCAFILGGAGCAGTEDSVSTRGPATLVFSGGPILALDPAAPEPEALAVGGGRILAIGTLAEIEPLRGPATADFDLGGRALAPAFVDHHVHLLNVGLALLYAAEPPADFVDLGGLSVEEIAARVAERATALPEGRWILGQGWSQGSWGAGALPGHEPLSAAAPRHPVYLTRVDAHAGWANARALAAAGLDARSPDPAGGSILRGAGGAPAGVLLERANEPLLRRVPEPSDEDVVRAFRRAAAELAAQGVVAVYDAGFLAHPGVVDLGLDFERYLRLLARADRESPLPLRVQLMVPSPSALARRVTADPGSRELSPRIRVTHIKLFADGAMGSRGALLSHPFADDPRTSGVARMSAAEIASETRAALDAGLDVATHAIGDLALRRVLDVYEEVLAERPGLDPRRLRIEHFSYARPEDFGRAAALGVVASVQPNFVGPDDDGVTMEDARVGPGNAARAYAWARLAAAGGRLAFGSDYFTRPLPPLATFFCAATRENLEGRPEGGWHPEERLPRRDALALATTLYPAGGGEPLGGRLAVGGGADLVVLSQDPLAADEGRILSIRVEATFSAGEPTPR